jgi:RNA polymerase sigma-70 factor (ECF subfamily)
MSDDRLRLIFTCCHPAIALDNRVALTLKTVAGLSTAQIARALLVSESTLSQRLLRTKQKIANAAIPYRVPPNELLAERTDGVLAVLYLIFNEGYRQPDDRLATEARRLSCLLVELMPNEDEARALLALITCSSPARPLRPGRRPRANREAGPSALGSGPHRRRPAAPPRRRVRRPPAPPVRAQIAACHATATAAQATPWALSSPSTTRCSLSSPHQ